MEQNIMPALISNAAVLLVLSVIYEATYLLPARFKRAQPFISGLVIAGVCILVMNVPFTLQPGIVFDTRSILISVTGLIFGAVPTIITAVISSVFRVSLGGAGALPGVAVIFTSALIGLLWRRYAYPRDSRFRWLSVLSMSVTVHAVMLGCMLLLGYPNSITVIRSIAVPVMVVYPIASIALSLFLMRQIDFRQVQEQLKQSRERFINLFDKAPMGYLLLNADGNLMEVNRQWLDLLGYTKHETIGRWFGDFLAPHCQAVFRDQYPVLKAQGHIHLDLEMLRKDGGILCISFEGNTGSQPDGSFLQAHCVVQDITSQKQMEEELRQSEEKHRRLYETMAQGVVYHAADGSILSANPAAEKILGMPVQTMRGNKSLQLFTKLVREDGTEMLDADLPAMTALRTGKAIPGCVVGLMLKPNTDFVWLAISAIPLFHAGEQTPYQVYTTFQDITAERKASHSYRLLFTEMVDAFSLHEMLYDAQGKPSDYRFLAVNPAFERMTGMKAADIIGKTVRSVMPDVEDYWIETYGKVALTGEPIRFNNYSSASDKHFEVCAYQPSPNQFACTFSDVTQRVRAEEEKKQFMLRLRSLLDNTPSPIMIMDEHGRLVEVSASARMILHLSDAGLAEGQLPETAPPEIVEKVARMAAQTQGQAPQLKGTEIVLCDGSPRYFESLLFPIHAPNDTERLFGYLAIDVTDRILAEQALQESEEKYSNYIENSPYGVFVVNDRGEYIEVNPSATAITGYPREQLLRMCVRDITAQPSMELALRKFEELRNTGVMSAEVQYVHQNGSVRWWTVDAVKLPGKRYLGFSIDITEKKNAEAELVYLSNHDYLTGLYNRRFFEAELTWLDMAGQLPLTVIIGDINGVKLVNDAFGHDQGDRLIRDCANIIAGCRRPGDTLARIGGDEFGLLLPNTDSAKASEILSQIQKALKASDETENRANFSHSVSLGFGTKRLASEDIRQTVRIADEYMYQRKLLEHNSSHSAILSSIKATMFEKSHETEEHAERLVALSRAVAAGLNLPQAERDRLELLATLHDIGKVGISDRILTKQSALNPEEWVEMKRHPEIGYRIAMSSPELVGVAEAILCHHEKWDGSGYPQGLRGETIPLVSRIIAVVDAYDAMTQDRPYRKAMSHASAIAEIRSHAGTQFDPVIAELFIRLNA